MRSKWKLPYFNYKFFFFKKAIRSTKIKKGNSNIPLYFKNKRIYLYNGYKYDSFILKNCFPKTNHKFIDFIPTKKTGFKIHRKEFKRKKIKKGKTKKK